MQYCQLGASGMQVSRVAFGVMTFGNWSYETFQARVDQGAADHMIGVALDAGVNLFDTAEAYGNGQGEQMLGAAIKRAGRERAIIATKALTYQAGPSEAGLQRNSYRYVVDHVEASLRRLDTDWIDLYQIQSADFGSPVEEETLRALHDLVSRGLIRHLGWANHPGWYAARSEAVQRTNGYTPFVSGQIYYSLVGRDAEHDILPYCRAAGLGTLVWSPLAGGFLTGKYTPGKPTGAADHSAVAPTGTEAAYRAIEVMRVIAEQHDFSVTQVAIAWLLAKPGVSSILVGASRPEQLAENIHGADVTLTDTEIAALDAIAPPAPIYPEPRWWTACPGEGAPFAGPPSLWGRPG
ncbi:MAG TPA: aldo/keto reductase [Solirubrobacteraceae bacterium]|nr:aldo/keto reductase [Solirubrobacteraceae bacterium]